MSKKDEPRRCYYISPLEYDEDRGYVPSLVVENEPGRSPMRGRGECAEPWYWGKTLESAEQTCDRVNKQRFGISPKTAMRIVASSMAAQNHGEGVCTAI